MLGALMTQSGAHDHVAHAHVLHDVDELVIREDRDGATTLTVDAADYSTVIAR